MLVYDVAMAAACVYIRQVAAPVREARTLNSAVLAGYSSLRIRFRYVFLPFLI